MTFHPLQRRVVGGIVGLIGYLLSPLSWWNDLWINIPLAYLAANGVALLYPAWFAPAFAGAYWLTNLLGLLLLHAGARTAVTPAAAPLRGGALGRWLLISLLYTLAILALVHSGLLRPWREYLGLS